MSSSEQLTQTQLSLRQLRQEEEKLLRQQQQLRERQAQQQLKLAQQQETKNEIRVLAESSVRRMVADQAITDLAGVVKELVDNALDAGSKSINVRLYGTGLDIVEVSDEGTGVPVASRPFLAQRHTTSKITNIDDIYQGIGLTMGFRGEALFSLAHCSQNLIVATRTASEPLAQKLEFRRDGSLDYSKIESIARKVGTTVAVVKPFDAQPARRADLERRIKGERAKTYRLLESYAILSVGVRINVFEMGGQRSDPLIATSPSSKSVSETVSSVIGHSFLSSLSPIHVNLKDIISPSRSPASAEKSPAQFRRVSTMSDDVDQGGLAEWKASGLVSCVTSAQSNRTVNYYSINGRPVELPSITAVLRKAWQTFGGKKRPSCILRLTLPNDRFDINISPDKREVLLTNDQEICNAVHEAVTALWSSQSAGRFASQKLEQQLSAPIATTAQDDHLDFAAASPEGRRRHKRRFAFVNDLSSARMQHDPSETTPTVPALSTPQHCTASSTTAPDEINGNPNTHSTIPTPGNSAKIVSIEELRGLNQGDDSCGDSPSVPENKRQKLSPIVNGGFESPPGSNGLSEVRRRLDGQLIAEEGDQSLPPRPSFSPRQHQIPNLLSTRPAPVTPDDTQNPIKPRSRMPSSQLSSVPELDDNISGPQVGKTSSGGIVQTSLERFSFRPVNKSAVIKRVDATQKEGRERRLINATDAKKSASNSSRNEGVLKTSVGQAKRQTPSSEDDGDEDDSLVVWSGFSSTEAVVHSARAERLDMRRRKVNIRNARRRPSSSDSSSEGSGDAEAAPSLGEVESKGVISLSKKIFRKNMQVIGQFNQGFIVACSSDNHIWILDQHACDEKHRFEKLCRNTVIHEQKLMAPMRLELSAAEEACILDNEDTFQANGFRFKFDPDAPIRHRLSLTALPHSGAQDGRKAVQFNKEDVSALCAMLSEGSAYDAGDGGTGTDGGGQYGNNAVRRHASGSSSTKSSSDRIIARLPKAIAMFASRACRTSIMIGKALSQKEMETVVRRMADLEQPWNCPHGRPTMRHVGDVQSTLLEDEKAAAEVIADSTMTIPAMTQDVRTRDESDDEEIN